MKRLAVLRHAKSSWDDPHLDDFDRPLSERGRKAAKRMGRELQDRGFAFDLVLASTAVRVRQTIEGLEGELGETPVRFEKDMYLAGEEDLLALVRALPESVRAPLLIGHNPGLEKLLVRLSANEHEQLSARVESKFPTAAFALVEIPVETWERVGPGSGTIVDLIVPKDLD